MKLFVALLLIMLNANDSNRGLIITEHAVILAFDNEMTKAELDSYKSILKKSYNIDIEYKKSKFDSKGKLLSIVMNIDCNDGSKGKVSSKIESNKRQGFYKTKTGKLFIGPLPEIKDIM